MTYPPSAHDRLLYALLIAGSVAHGQERNTRDARGHDNHRPRACRRAKPAPLDEAIAVFRSPLITQPELVRVHLELAFFLREKDSASAFRDRAGDIPPAFAANVGRTDFDGPQPRPIRARMNDADETRTFRLSAYNRALTLWGFSPRLSIARETRDSNAQLHDYERTSGDLQFVQLF